MNCRLRAHEDFHTDDAGLATLMGGVFDVGSLDRSGRLLTMAGSAADGGTGGMLVDAGAEEVGEPVETGTGAAAAAKAKAKAKATGRGKRKDKPAAPEAELVTPTGDAQGAPASVGKWVAGILKDISGARDLSARLENVPYCGEPTTQFWGLPLCVFCGMDCDVL